MRMTMMVTALCSVVLTMQVAAQLQLPVQWSTYLGGSGDDQMRALCVDRDDNVYVCGVFTSPDFPAARGVPSSFDTSRANGGGYLASFSPTGDLRWLQYFGCARPYEVAISDEGVLVMVGATAVECGRVDATISTFTTTGERYAQAYVLGGLSEVDIATSVDIIGSTIYVGGITQSPDLQTTANAFQAGPQGGVDGFIAKLVLTQTPAGWQVVPDVVTYFGGRALDNVLVIRARNTLGGVYIGGSTRSDKLPGNGVLQPTRIGTLQDDDGFVARLDSATLVCQWYTYCGGAGNEVVYGLQPYRSNQPGPGGEPFTIRACGVYGGRDFPWPGNPASSAPFGGGTALGGDAFLLQIRDGAMMQATTWNVSTTGDDILCSFTRANTNTGPLLFSNGFYTCQNSTFNAYRLNPYPGSNPTGLSAFCGNNDEVTLDVEQYGFGFGGIDEGPNATYICGSTTSTIIPGTDAPGPVLQRTSGGGRDGFLVKVGCGASGTTLKATNTVLCSAADSITVTLEPAPADVRWQDGDSTAVRVIRTPGTYRVQYTLGTGCSYTDSVVVTQGTYPMGTLMPSDTVTLCDSDGVLLTVTSGSNIDQIRWSNGDINRDTTLRVRTPGRYSATLFSPQGCTIETDTVTVVGSIGLAAGTSLAMSFAGADSAKMGEVIRVVLRLSVPVNTNLAAMPTDWAATVRFNKTMLLPEVSLPLGSTDDSLRFIRVSGRRNATSDTLGWIDLRVALGETDTTTISVDSLRFEPCGEQLPSQVLRFRTAGICRLDSVGRYISTRDVVLSAIVAANPVGPEGATGMAVGSAIRGATARIVTMLGQDVSLGEPIRAGDTVEWAIPSWLSPGRYIFLVQSGSHTASTIFEVVR